MSKQGEIIREMLKAYVSIIGTVDERLEAVEILNSILSEIDATAQEQRVKAPKTQRGKKRKIPVRVTESNLKTIKIIALAIWRETPGIAESVLSESVGLSRTTFNKNKELHSFYLRLLAGEANIAPVTVDNDPFNNYPS